MGTKKFNHPKVRRASLTKALPVLKFDKLHDPKLPVGEFFEPAFDFVEVVRVYRLSNVERRRLNVDVDNPGIVAVVC